MSEHLGQVHGAGKQRPPVIPGRSEPSHVGFLCKTTDVLHKARTRSRGVSWTPWSSPHMPWRPKAEPCVDFTAGITFP